MIQCTDCEHHFRGPAGQIGFNCDPFSNVKEPECLIKWQLIKLDMMVRAYQATVDLYRRFAPLQEKLFKHMQQELDEQEDSDRWKHGLDEEDPNAGEDSDQ